MTTAERIAELAQELYFTDFPLEKDTPEKRAEEWGKYNKSGKPDAAARRYIAMAERAKAFLSSTDAGQPDAKGDDDEGMMRVGYSLMASIEAYYEHPSMKGWAPADDPAEIVGDLLNIIDEKDAQIAEARNAALDEAIEAVLDADWRDPANAGRAILANINALKTQTDGATE